MKGKLLIGLSPLLVAAAFAVAPVAAQATPGHYFRGGLGAGSRIPAGERISTISWGTLGWTSLTVGRKTVCHNVIGGVVENPEPGGETGPAGVGETETLAFYECESEMCTPTATGGGPGTYLSMFAEGSEAAFPATGRGTMTSPNTGTTLPTEEPLVASGDNLKWKYELIEEGTKVRQEFRKMKINVICHVMTGTNAKGESEFGAQATEVSKGNNKPLALPHCCTPLAPGELSFDPKSGELENEKGQKSKTEGSLKTLGYVGVEAINAKQG